MELLKLYFQSLVAMPDQDCFNLKTRNLQVPCARRAFKASKHVINTAHLLRDRTGSFSVQVEPFETRLICDLRAPSYHASGSWIPPGSFFGPGRAFGNQTFMQATLSF